MPLLDRHLLRLHIEAVWGVHLPVIDSDEVQLYADTPQPSWKLLLAELAEEHIQVWRPGAIVYNLLPAH